MKIDKPQTKQEQIAALADNLERQLAGKTRRKLIEALSNAILDGKEVARGEYDLSAKLIMAALCYGERIGEKGTDGHEVRLVLDTKVVGEIESGAWVMVQELMGDRLVLRVTRKGDAPAPPPPPPPSGMKIERMNLAGFLPKLIKGGRS